MINGKANGEGTLVRNDMDVYRGELGMVFLAELELLMVVSDPCMGYFCKENSEEAF